MFTEIDWSVADRELAWRIMSVLGIPNSSKPALINDVANEIEDHRTRMNKWFADWDAYYGGDAENG